MVTNPALRWLGIICAVGVGAVQLAAVNTGYEHSSWLGAVFVVMSILVMGCAFIVGVGYWPRLETVQKGSWLLAGVLGLVEAGLVAAVFTHTLNDYYHGRPLLGWTSLGLGIALTLVSATVVATRGRRAVPHPTEEAHSMSEASRPQSDWFGGVSQ